MKDASIAEKEPRDDLGGIFLARKMQRLGHLSVKQPVGVILAGGRATRMGGGDKSLRLLAGQPILEHVIARLAPQVAHVALNANGDAARFSGFGVPVIADSVPDFAGPLAGVLAGLDWAAAQGAETVVTVAADTPFFPADLVPHLLMAGEDMTAPLVLATSDDGRHPTFGLWPVALREDLRAALLAGLRKVVLWSDGHSGRTAHFSGRDPDPFFNINTPEDLALAERWT